MNVRMFVAGLALAALAAAGTTRSATAQVQVPFRGTLEGAEEVLAPPPLAVLHGVGGGEATHLGRFLYDLDATVDFNEVPPLGSGLLTLTGAHGDALLAEIDGSSTPIMPGVIAIVEEATIVDGTGRFAGASGSFTITRLKNQVTGETFGSFEGTISLPLPINP